LDNFTLLRIAKAFRSYHDALSEGEYARDAEAALNEHPDMPKFQYRSSHEMLSGEPFLTLKEQPILLPSLIDYLEHDLGVLRPLKAEIKRMNPKDVFHDGKVMQMYDQEKVSFALWEKYEFVRRMAASEVTCLVVQRT
jgi:hypothetical protein